MDFGALSVVGLGHSPTGSAPIHDSNPNDNGSGHTLKHKRSDNEDEGSRPSKLVSRVDDFRAVPLIHQGTPLLQRSSSGGQMLSFSCSSDKQEVCFLSGSSKDGGDGNSKSVPQNLGLSYYHSAASVGCYSRNAGISSGSLNGNMHGSISGIKGPFTPAQWIELEHQALIYKYIVANVPVPSSLLIPIRKALTHSGFPGFSAGSYPAHSFGWGTFHLGFSGNTDPEPGRCRRTDGKKWRCSRDAVPDQKYCERHINRGRHRSRKPVEGHSGQVASGTTHPRVVPSSMSSSVSLSNGGASNNNNNNSLTIAQNHQMKKGLQPPAAPTNSSTDSIANRAQDSQCLSVVTPTVTLKPNPPFSILKQHNPFDESSQSEFGLISTESLLNPSHKNSYLNCKNYNSFLEYGDQQPQQDQYPLRHFMDDWTQLSMSIPMSSDFSSSSSSPNRDKNALSPLRLSRELDPTHMNLGVGNVSVPWGNSMGGPLGEVLNNAGGGPLGGMAASKGGSSPTGVLQKVTFVSLSNNSSGGSPTKVENKTTHESVSLCDDLLGSTHASASSIPSI